jgi:hypothetical protein
VKTSEQINELAAALAKAQGEMKNPPLDGTNPHFRSRYASLAAVRDAVLPVMAKHGISVTQELTTEAVNGAFAVGCTVRLMHASGQWMEAGPFVVPVSKADAQGAGAASTYARRFTLQTVAGVVGDEDDDGEVAVGRGAKPPAKAPAAPANADFPPAAGPIGTPQKPAQAPPDCWTRHDDVALAKVAGKIGPEVAKEKAASFGFKKEKGLVANYGLDGNDLALMRAWMAAEVGA